jgi:P4 family phage/plasmid primase-like protien
VLYLRDMLTSVTAANAVKEDKLQALRERAKYLLEIGYWVIQTGKDGDPKRPLKVGWNLNFARKPETIDGWEWPSEEGAGIAIVPDGPVVAIDIDAPNKEGGPDASLTEMYFNELNTTFPLLAHAWKEKTPNGGYHIVVRAAPDVPIPKLKTQAQGKYGVKIELKSARRHSLVVAPTEVKGKPYETLHGPVPKASLPEMGKEFFEYLGLLPQPKAPPKKRADGEGVGASFANSLLHEAHQLIETAVKGNRNNSVNKAFFYLGRVKAILGDRFEEVYTELYNRCKEKLVGPDFPESELRRTAKSGLQAGELEPLDPQKEVFLITPRDLAAIVLRERGDDIVYIEGIGWHVWNGRYWQRMPKERGIAAIIDEVLIEKYKVWREAADPTDEDYIKWLKKIGRAIGDPDYLEKIQRAILKVNVDGKSRFISQEKMPKPEENGHLLPVANGVIDLRTGELYPHEQFKSKYLFGGLETPYDPNARAPHFEAAMRTWFAGDAEMIDYMQEVLGSCLTGDTSAQKMYIFYGNTANGKSTLILITAEILENYAERAPSDLFKKHKKDTHPAMYMTLFGKRMVYVPDFPEKTPLDEEIIKSQTGDKLSGRYMRENHVSFYPTHKAIIATNDLPRVTGSEEAVFRRVVPIPFKVTFNKSRRLDPHFLEKLRREKPGILRWLVEGAKKYYSDPKREPPKAVGNLWEAYQRREDPVAAFVAACIEAAPGEGVTRADAYQAFERYWEYRFGKGVKPPTPNSFTIKFKKVANPEEGIVNRERGYLNIRVRPVWEDLDDKILLEEKNADELPETLFLVPKEPELPLYIAEYERAYERIADLTDRLVEKVAAEKGWGEAFSLRLRQLHAMAYGAAALLQGETNLPLSTPKEGLAVMQKVIEEAEKMLNGEEVALEPLPKLPEINIPNGKAYWDGEEPTDPDPTPPSPIGPDPTPNLPPREGEPKWEYVTDASQLPEIEERLQREDAVGWDLETVGHPGTIGGALHPATGRARLIQFVPPYAPYRLPD